VAPSTVGAFGANVGAGVGIGVGTLVRSTTVHVASSSVVSHSQSAPLSQFRVTFEPCPSVLSTRQ
jgi:hypothetical protein